MTVESRRPLVLIVEDDADTRDMYALFLDFSAVGVVTAANAEVGFALAVEHQPDVIVTDFMLSGPGTGGDLCRRLRQHPLTAAVPVIVLTGSSRESDTRATIDAGCNEIRLKPYLPDALLNDIRELLARPAA